MSRKRDESVMSRVMNGKVYWLFGISVPKKESKSQRDGI
jgi:hypothetical protein